MWGKRGFIVVDDTFIDKDGKLLPGAAYLYNHRRKVGSGKGGALTIGDCQRALEDEVFRDLLELIVEKALGDEKRMPKEKQRLVMELMEVLKG